MELVYLWVEEYKNIKNQGFNFSPRFTCKYEGGKLTIDKKEYVSIFPDNINVTAIVGENGSGKSSLFKALLSGFGFKITVIYHNGIFSIHTSREIKLINSTKIAHHTNSNSLKQEAITLRNFSWDILKYEYEVGFAQYFNVDTNILTSLFNTFLEPMYLNLYSYKRLFILKLLKIYIKYQPENFEYIPKKVTIRFNPPKDANGLDFKEINSEIDKLRFYSEEKEEVERKKINNYEKILNISNLYENHKDIVAELLQKKEIYNDSYIDELMQKYEGTLFKNREDLLRLITCGYVSDDDLHKRPLSKLIKDISEELNLI